MTKYNVKKIENTNTMITTLTTSCKKRDTAINRFCRFLSEYDSCFKDSLLIATTHICYAGDCNNIVYKAVSESDEYILTYTEYTQTDDDKSNVVFTVIIEFKHDDNTTHYKSLANTSVSDNTNETTDSAESNNKTPVELKDDINKKYGVNAVYYDTDSILYDDKKQNVYVVQHNNNDKEVETKQLTYNIKAYYDGKELTVPCDKYKCKQYALEYIKALYENHVVEYETLFIIYYGKHAETITIENVLDVTDLIEYNIDDINNGLKNDNYKKVREGVERLCALIDDNHVCVVGFKYTKHTFDYAITKSKDQDSYNFKRGNNNRIQKPSEIARFIFYHIFAHEFELKYWHTIK